VYSSDISDNSKHPSHPSHLSFLSNIGILDTLNPTPHDTTPTDSHHKAFITEMDSNDPGLSEGYFADNSLNPLPTDTPLLPTHYTSRHYTNQTTLNGQPPDIPLDTLDGHSSLMGV
jgi:hypothetical protein